MSTAEIVKVDTPSFVVAEGGQRHNVGDYAQLDRSTDDLRMVELWINRERKSDSEHTRAQYRTSWEQFSEAVSLPLQAIKVFHLEAWAKSLDKAPATRKIRISAIKSLFSYAFDLGYLRVNPARTIVTPSIPSARHKRILTEEEVLTMIAVTKSQRNRALLRVLYSSGARISELLALTWQDVVPVADGKAALMIFGKGGKSREAGISAATYNELLKLRKGAADYEPVFKSNRGTALDRSVAVRIVKAAAQAAGIDKDVSPHWFRHAHVTHALARGANPVDVQQQAGHSSLAITTSYAHADKYSADVLAV